MIQKAIDLVPEDWRSRFPETVSELGLLGNYTLQALLERWPEESEEATLIRMIMEGNTAWTPPLIFCRPRDWLKVGRRVVFAITHKNGSMSLHGPKRIADLYHSQCEGVVATKLEEGETVLSHYVFYFWEIERLRKNPLLLNVWIRGFSARDQVALRRAIEGFWLP